jgi:hypothetical protein
MLNGVCYFQNVRLEHMASTVETAVIHVLAKYLLHNVVLSTPPHERNSNLQPKW